MGIDVLCAVKALRALGRNGALAGCACTRRRAAGRPAGSQHPRPADYLNIWIVQKPFERVAILKSLQASLGFVIRQPARCFAGI